MATLAGASCTAQATSPAFKSLCPPGLPPSSWRIGFWTVPATEVSLHVFAWLEGVGSLPGLPYYCSALPRLFCHLLHRFWGVWDWRWFCSDPLWLLDYHLLLSTDFMMVKFHCFVDSVFPWAVLASSCQPLSIWFPSTDPGQTVSFWKCLNFPVMSEFPRLCCVLDVEPSNKYKVLGSRSQSPFILWPEQRVSVHRGDTEYGKLILGCYQWLGKGTMWALLWGQVFLFSCLALQSDSLTCLETPPVNLLGSELGMTALKHSSHPVDTPIHSLFPYFQASWSCFFIPNLGEII